MRTDISSTPYFLRSQGSVMQLSGDTANHTAIETQE